MNEINRPLVTFALFAYNQEEFILEAVKAALAQDYEPLEIIFSDDCSTDNTFAIIQDAVRNYTGPHNIIINKNKVNLGSRGLGAHVNKILEIWSGDLLVFAAGDDISMPHRTKTLVNAWIKAGRPDGSIHSAVEKLTSDDDEPRRVLEGDKFFGRQTVLDCVKNGAKGVLGASHVITRGIYERFGRLPDEVLFEDRAFAFRSLLIGKVIYCPQVLLKYRVHEKSISGNEYADRVRWERWIDGMIIKYKTFLSDYQSVIALGESDPSVLLEINKCIQRLELSRPLVGGEFLERIVAGFNYSANFKASSRIAFLLLSAGPAGHKVARALRVIYSFFRMKKIS